jgi:oligopeptidase B
LKAIFISPVISYLKAENTYTNAALEHTQGLQDRLFEEIKGRIKQTDVSVPYKLGDYQYYTRFEDDQEYPIHCRQALGVVTEVGTEVGEKTDAEAPEEILLDLNELAQGHRFYAVGSRQISSNQNILAFAADTTGRRIYTIHFKDLDSGTILAEHIPEAAGNLTWAEDNRTLFYTKQDPQTLRWDRIYRHTLGTDPAADPLIFYETDETFSCHVGKTKSKRYILIGSWHTLSSEYRFVEADQPHGAFRLFQPRQRHHEYDIEHYGEYFYIRTNHQAKNFRLMQTPVSDPTLGHWTELIAHRQDVLLEGFELFRDHLVLQERKQGLVQLHVRPWSGAAHYLDFGEPAYLASSQANYEFDTPLLRYAYTSLTTPETIYDYHMDRRDKTLLKQDEVLGGFDAGQYRTERLCAQAPDGTSVPISLVYRSEPGAALKKTGDRPLLLYGYGSYGASMDATFSAARLSLLDRGFVYAIAHIRGGEELGRAWYEDGKLLNKKNTFTDFVACAEFLVKQGYSASQRLYIAGGSAGGLLVGAVLNLRPDLFNGAVAQVPFVDVVTTMLDASIPLTTGEYDEWGNPNEKTYYDYMLSYSPYDQVERKAYPHLLVTTSLEDSQVQYWEPAKWVAKLRAYKTDTNRLLLRTTMEAGHGGPSGRYRQYRETAFWYAFLLDLEGGGQ